MDGIIGFGSCYYNEDAEVEQQNRELGEKYDRAKQDRFDVRHLPRMDLLPTILRIELAGSSQDDSPDPILRDI